jgi:hypothetical protein
MASRMVSLTLNGARVDKKRSNINIKELTVSKSRKFLEVRTNIFALRCLNLTRQYFATGIPGFVKNCTNYGNIRCS